MDEDFNNDLNEMNEMDDLEGGELDESMEDTGGFDNYSEPKRFSKNFLVYGIALLWSFFIVFIFMYYFMYKRNQTNFSLFPTQALEQIDSTQVRADSLASIVHDSSEGFAEDDSGRGYYVPPEGFLSMEDHMRILKLENGRRKREIDFLWNELRTIKKQRSVIDNLTQKVDSLESVEPQTIVVKDTTPSFELRQQQQLFEEQKEQLRQEQLLAEEQEKDAAIAKSAKIYSSMKPKQAATIIASFDSETAAELLMKIRERQAAKILESMEPQKATQICQYMSQ